MLLPPSGAKWLYPNLTIENFKPILRRINKMKKIAGLLALFVTLPIWYYLLYKILLAVNASELMWFLFWVYFPASILVNTLVTLTKD